ncbi:hypothetical protein GLOIN_2v1784311 [Rhizophagus irregularis DAOM 181602=DAOM 197198]|nr:hypothetical protein GLOIN_2v1784311 [Rhizophagus irregularis DAOM 181602=DAOM 197198]
MAIYSCPHCERVFSRRASLQNHVKTHDDIIDKVLREIAEEVEHKQEEVGDNERLEKVSYKEKEEKSTGKKMIYPTHILHILGT